MLSISSCHRTIYGDDVKLAQKLCANNDGIKRIEIENDFQGIAQCNNGTLLHINNSRKENVNPENYIDSKQLDFCPYHIYSQEGLNLFSTVIKE